MNTPRPSGTPLKEGTSAPIARLSFERAQRLPSREGRTRSAGVCFRQNIKFAHSRWRSRLHSMQRGDLFPEVRVAALRFAVAHRHGIRGRFAHDEHLFLAA